MEHLETALRLVAMNANEASFVGPRNKNLVAAAERALGVSFPPSYRRFLAELGAGDIWGEEFYGITGPNFTNGSVPNGIWLTLDVRREGLPQPFVIVAASDDGFWYTLDTSIRDRDGESPVVALSLPGLKVKRIATDFGEFFLTTIREAQAHVWS